MIKHKYLQKRFKALHKNRIYAHMSKLTEEQAIILNANLNFCERIKNNYFSERRELE